MKVKVFDKPEKTGQDLEDKITKWMKEIRVFKVYAITSVSCDRECSVIICDE